MLMQVPTCLVTCLPFEGRMMRHGMCGPRAELCRYVHIPNLEQIAHGRMSVLLARNSCKAKAMAHKVVFKRSNIPLFT